MSNETVRKTGSETVKKTGYATLNRLGGSYSSGGTKVIGGQVVAISDEQKKVLTGFDESPVKVFSTEKAALEYVEKLKKKGKK